MALPIGTLRYFFNAGEIYTQPVLWSALGIYWIDIDLSDTMTSRQRETFSRNDVSEQRRSSTRNDEPEIYQILGQADGLRWSGNHYLSFHGRIVDVFFRFIFSSSCFVFVVLHVADLDLSAGQHSYLVDSRTALPDYAPDELQESIIKIDVSAARHLLLSIELQTANRYFKRCARPGVD